MWPMLLVHVWTWLYNCFNVNMVLIIEHNCEKNVLNFRLISCDKRFPISFTTLCPKITKSLLKNLTLKKKISNNIANNLPQWSLNF
jgi:hypothetical protein